jgi:hypothetical protein
VARPRVTLAVRVAIGVVTWLVLVFLAILTWDDFVEATGDTLNECDRGTCGALGEFTDDHPLILFTLILVGTAIPAVAAGWLCGRLLRRRDSSA